MASPSGPYKLLLPVLVLAPALAGCTWFQAPPPPPTPRFHVLDTPYVVPGLDLRIDHRFGFIRLAGDVLAFPVEADGQELGAVYLGASVHWRFDAVFQTRERSNITSDVFVEAPQGTWDGQRATQAWRNASAADLARFGFANEGAAHARAQKPAPANFSRPVEGLWTLNGTVAAQVRPQNFTLAVEEGPLVFQRNDTGFLVVENRTVMHWDGLNLSLDASQDALLRAHILDPELARIELQWSRARVDIRVITPPFRRTDLKEDEDPISKLIAITLPNVAEVAAVKYVTATRDDNRIELRSANMTLIAAPA